MIDEGFVLVKNTGSLSPTKIVKNNKCSLIIESFGTNAPQCEASQIIG